VYHLV